MTIAAWQQILDQHDVAASGKPKPILASHEVTVRDTTSAKRFEKRKRMTQEERHLQILRAASKILAVKGYWGMSLQDISDEIGISEAALYHYIASKEDLLDMVLTEGYDTTEANEFAAYSASAVDADGHRIYYYPRYCLTLPMTRTTTSIWCANTCAVSSGSSSRASYRVCCCSR